MFDKSWEKNCSARKIFKKFKFTSQKFLDMKSFMKFFSKNKNSVVWLSTPSTFYFDQTLLGTI